MKEVYELLHCIQKNLNAPKSQFNTFGGFQYRTLEDITEGVKKLLPEGATLILTNEMINLGARYYVEATATLNYLGHSISNKAAARESYKKSKFDEPQLTGAASTYARKAALSGLFLCDDTRDSDTLNKLPPVYDELLNAFNKNDNQAGYYAWNKLTDDEKTKGWKLLKDNHKEWIRNLKAMFINV